MKELSPLQIALLDSIDRFYAKKLRKDLIILLSIIAFVLLYFRAGLWILM